MADDGPPVHAQLPGRHGANRAVFVVDAFRYRQRGHVYLLSHFHADHYVGITERWRDDVIYCSPVTARLLEDVLYVPSEWVRPLAVGVPHALHGAELTLLDANHCPGAVMFLLRAADGSVHLHTGDFRFHERFHTYAPLRQNALETLFLDTTYAHPRHVLPSQASAVRVIGDLVARTLADADAKPGDRPLILIATYVVGKEAILLDIAQRCRGERIYARPDKLRVLSIVGAADPAISSDARGARIHVCGWNLVGRMAPGNWRFVPDYDALRDYLEHASAAAAADGAPPFTRLVAVVPTGWTALAAQRATGKDVAREAPLGPAAEPPAADSTTVDFQDGDDDLLAARLRESAASDAADAAAFVTTERDATGSLVVHAVPYSEHCDFRELCSFVALVKPARIVPTVVPASVRAESIVKRLLPFAGRGAAARQVAAMFRGAAAVGNGATQPPPPSLAAISADAVASSHVACPICGAAVAESNINEHLDVGCRDAQEDALSNGRGGEDEAPREATAAELLRQLLPGVPLDRCAALLRENSTHQSGDVARAANAFFDTAAAPSPQQSPTKRRAQQLTIDTFLASKRARAEPSAAFSDEGARSREPTAALPLARVNVNDALPDPVPPPPVAADRPLSTSDAQVTVTLPGCAAVTFQRDGAVPFALLCAAFERLSSTSSRLEIVALLAALFAAVIEHAPADLIAVVFLCTNTFAPPHVPFELGVGPAALMAALQDASGRSAASLRALYAQHGDLGDVAAAACASVGRIALGAPRRAAPPSPQPPINWDALPARVAAVPDFWKPYATAPLTARGVFVALYSLVGCRGQGAAAARRAVLRALILAASSSASQARFLVRIAARNLRVGAVGVSVLDALARAFGGAGGPGSPLREAAAVCPDYRRLVEALQRGGIAAVRADISFVLFTPLRPMLGRITRGLAEIVARLGGQAVAFDLKYDGQRAQVHWRAEDGSCRVFSRHLEDMTEQYPQAAAAVQQSARHGQVRSVVLDAEVVAVDSSGAVLPFQALASRARRAESAKLASSAAVALYAFDVMALNDVSLLAAPFAVRRALLAHYFQPDASFQLVPQRLFFAAESSLDDMDAYLRAAVGAGCEGVMVKPLGIARGQVDLPAVHGLDDAWQSSAVAAFEPPLRALWASAATETDASLDVPSATYEPSKRSAHWLKVKKDYVDGLADSLDLVPIAAWRGNGRKVRFLSPILMAARNAETGVLEGLCKCMTGFSDAFYRELTEFYSRPENHFAMRPPGVRAAEGLAPDMWLRPCHVWEIRGAELTLSPEHVAASAYNPGGNGRGLSLRFPRFMRVREDKGIEQATSTRQLVEMFRRQVRQQVPAGADDVEEDEEL